MKFDLSILSLLLAATAVSANAFPEADADALAETDAGFGPGAANPERLGFQPRSHYAAMSSPELQQMRHANPFARDELHKRGDLVLAKGEQLGLPHLTKRGTKHCSNDGNIKRNKYDPKCLPSNSKGWRSAHNCKTKSGGKTYLCVQGGQATCYGISDAVKNNFEGGECFI